MWLGKTFVWTYDDAGNITSCKEYAYTDHTQAVTGTPVKRADAGIGHYEKIRAVAVLAAARGRGAVCVAPSNCTTVGIRYLVKNVKEEEK